jgi:dUTPase
MAKKWMKGNPLSGFTVYYSNEVDGLELVKANPTDWGYDLKSSVDLTIDPGQFKTVPTGI